MVFDAFESGAARLCSCNLQSSSHRLGGHLESVQKGSTIDTLSVVHPPVLLDRFDPRTKTVGQGENVQK